MSNNNTSYESNNINTSQLGPTTNLQLMFAKLQMEQAETAKTQAMERMEMIQKQQEEQKL